MKKFILLLLFFSLNVNLFADDTNKAKLIFKKLMETAHPVPQRYIDKKIEVPYSEPVQYPFFLNYNLIETEIDPDPMQNESSIAVNPLNPEQLIGSAVDYRDNSSTWVYYSEDGGYTWKNFNLGKPFPNWRSTNDPSVAYDPLGNAYLVYGGFGYIDDSSYGENFGENGVFISKSTDGGKTWLAENCHIPVILHKGKMTIDSTFEDKYYISVDNASLSPYKNNLYIPWKRVTPCDSATQIVLSKSTDAGKTWSEPIAVSPRKSGTSQDTTYGQSFPLVATGPEGEVYVVWNDGIIHGVGFAKSTDGGKTFSEPRIIQTYNIFGITNNLAINPKDEPVWRHSVKGVVRAEAYPVLIVDTTQFENRGTLYLTWAADNVPNIYFSKSTDKGESWSNPKIIHSDTTNDQFWQWMAVDPMTGDLAVMYLDSRDDPDNLMVECYVSFSSDGGETWVDRQISDFRSDLRLNPFYNHFAGDYSGMAFYNGKIYPSWVDMRNAINNIKDNDVYTAIVNVNKPLPVENFKASSEYAGQPPYSIKLEWDYNNGSIFGRKLDTNEIKFIIKRENQIFEIFSDKRSFIDENLEAHKNYVYEIYVASSNDTSYVRVDSAYAGGAKEIAAAELVSASGYDNNEISIIVKFPEFRADGETKLNYLKYLKVYDNYDNLLYSFDIDDNYIGKESSFSFQVASAGYYSLYVKVFDEFGQESIKSDDIEIFTGPIGVSFSDNFDTDFKNYKLNEQWGITNKFYLSPNYSLTDSPEGNYKKYVDNYLVLFPLLSDSDKEMVMEFWHAALIYERDSAQVQYSKDNGENWETIAYYNENDYSYWSDGVLDQNDWKYEKLIFKPSVKDTIYIRFNIKSKLGKSLDGWYIDDLIIYSRIVSVKEDHEKEITLYPNPAGDFVNLYIEDSKFIKDIKILSLVGELMQFGREINDSNVILDISRLEKGVYFILINYSNKNYLFKFVKIY